MQLLVLEACDYANMTRDGKLNVMGIFREINARSFPARHASMYVVVKMRAELGETSEPRSMVVQLRDADARQLAAVRGRFRFPKASGGRRPEFNAVLAFNNLVFPQQGVYEFVVVVDDDPKGQLPIYLNHVPRPKRRPGQTPPGLEPPNDDTSDDDAPPPEPEA